MEKKPFACGKYGEVVFMAKWRKNNVVVNVINACSEKEEEDVKCKANVSLHLNHAKVIKLFVVSCVKSRKFGIMMKKAEHDSLDISHMWIRMTDYEKLTKIALGFVDSLEYEHSQKVIYRDNKSKKNLMFQPKYSTVAKIADFDMSAVIETVIKTQSRTRLTHSARSETELTMWFYH